MPKGDYFCRPSILQVSVLGTHAYMIYLKGKHEFEINDKLNKDYHITSVGKGVVLNALF